MPPRRQSASKRQSSSKRTSAPKRSSAPAAPSRGVKRKLEHTDPPTIEKGDGEVVIVQDGDEDVVVLPTKRVRTDADPAAPASKKQQQQQKKKKKNDDENETPARTARRPAQQKTLDGFLKPAPSPLAQRAGNSPAAAAVATTATASAVSHDSPLPDALAALVPLHAALLTALLLHRAQNSSGVLPAFAALKPHVERLTGKSVSLDDVRRIVFLSHYTAAAATTTTTTTAPPPTTTTTAAAVAAAAAGSGLQLLDYGAGRIMVKFVEAPGSTALTQHAALKQAFGRHVRQFWHGTGTTDVPLAAIADHEHRATIKSVLHAKSQRLMRELRAVPAKAAAAAGGAKGGAGTKGGGGATAKARGTSLLERVRAKAAMAAAIAGDGPPSAAALVQRAAEGRVPEVTEILRGLRARGVSVGLHAAVDAVRASVRSPMGAAEAEAALRLVGQREPWCVVREVGGVAAVVFGAFEGGGRFV